MRATKEPQGKPKTVRKTKRDKEKEQLSEHELKELMGIHRDTYTRRSGAIRKR